MTTTRKFFDKDWKEVPPEQAVFAVELEHDKDGRVTSSRQYIVKEKGETRNQ